MTPNEFVMWFRGFSEACHHLNPTPQQWEKILEKLQEVKEEAKACTCSSQVYKYPYVHSNGTFISTDASKQQLND